MSKSQVDRGTDQGTSVDFSGGDKANLSRLDGSWQIDSTPRVQPPASEEWEEIPKGPELSELLDQGVTLAHLANAFSMEDSRDMLEEKLLTEFDATPRPLPLPKTLRWFEGSELRSDLLHGMMREVARAEVMRFARILDTCFELKRKEKKSEPGE